MGTRVAGEVVRRRYTVTGVVQGVGFRPFVHRIAAELALSGFVGNAAGAVFVEVQGDADAVAVFADRLVAQAPPLARIAAVVESARPLGGEAGFAIVPSRGGAGVTPIPPDVALCADCLRELFDPTDRRYRHPFITCTNCGPAVHDHHRAALRPPGHHDGGLPDVRGVRGGVFGPGRPPLPRPAGVLPRLRPRP
jgi:hydrogenase maturation protein HypF